MAFLRIKLNDEESVLELGQDTVSVGRAPGNRVVVPGGKVSRYHAKIEHHGSGYKIVDLGSTNGVRVNGDFVQQKILRPGDEVRIGVLRAVFETGSSAPRSPERRAADPVTPRVAARPPAGRPTPPRPERPEGQGARPVRSTSSGPGLLIASLAAAVVIGLAGLIVLSGGDGDPEPAAPATTATEERTAPSETPSEAEVPEPRLAEREPADDKAIDPVDPVVVEPVHPPKQDPAEHRTPVPRDTRARVAENRDRRVPVEEQLVVGAPTEPLPEEYEDLEEFLDDSEEIVEDEPETSQPLLTRKEAYRYALEAEELAEKLRFDEAVDAFEDLLPGCKDEDVRAEFRQKIADLEAQKALLAALIAKIGEGGGFIQRYQISGLGRIKSADEEGLVCSKGRVLWHEMRSWDFIRLCQKVPIDADHRIAAAIYAFDVDKSDRGHQLLIQAAEWDPEKKPKVDAVYSRISGVPIPSGGFVVYKDHLMSPERKDRLAHLDKADTYLVMIDSKKPEKVREGFEAIVAMGGPALARGVERLGLRRSQCAEILRRHKTTSKLKRIRDERERLDAERDRALALILDQARYPHPYKPPEASADVYATYQQTQKRIEEVVGKVRKLWRDPPSSRTITLGRDFTEQLELLQAYDRALARVDQEATPPEDAEFLSYLDPARRSVSIQTFFLSPEQRDDFHHNEFVMAENEAAAGAKRTEKYQVRITNDYRILMGRRALRIDSCLMESARGHSDEMGRKGFFGHESPTPGRKTVGDRVRLAGFEGTDYGENIAYGMGPQAAHESWITSPGHHRNILDRRWSAMGVGNSGSMWTQNFGSGK